MQEIAPERKGVLATLAELWPFFALVIGWIVLQRWILPSMGVPT